MTDDLVERLREMRGPNVWEAADRIEELEKNFELQLEWYLSNKRRLDDRIEELEAALKWISEYNDDIPAEPPTEIGEESKKLWVALIICTCRAKYALKEKKDD